MTNKINKGFLCGGDHIDLDWTVNDHRSLPYKREPFNDQESIEKWKEQGHTQKHFTGEMYSMARPCPHWFNANKLANMFGLREMGWSFYKMSTGVILPEHVDKFVRYKQLFPDDTGTIVRVLIMLEDWQEGHYLDLAGEQATMWKRGDYFWWTEIGPHAAANIGTADRYTLQLTGFMDL